jgi:hypothetical protein
MNAEVDVAIIPAGTRLHLWDSKSKHISDAFFYSTGDLNVLVKKGHGPMYKLLQDLHHTGEEVLHHTDLNQLWNETKEAAKDLPFIRNLVTSDRVMNSLQEVTNLYQDVDAIFMAYGNEGKIALQFIHPGEHLNISYLQ